MTRVDEPKPLDPRLTSIPDVTARMLNSLPTGWLDQLLEGTK
ncbi:hypothetical protein AB4Z38_06955 [Arthrobacter sp. 2RAF6]